MVFGVAFVSIVLQVPLLSNYVKRKIPESDAFSETELDKQFTQVSSTLEEARQLRAEGKISNKEFTEKLEESKERIDKLIAQSRVTVETKKIIQARTSVLFPSLPKKPKRKEKKEEAEKEKQAQTDSN
jgi:F0F1-type ATP synthase membrane subunit b/b'